MELSGSKKIEPEAVIAELKDSALRGRGGAGFPTGLKWGLCLLNFPFRNTSFAIQMKVNLVLLKTRIYCDTIHIVIEGMLIAAYAMGITAGYNYIHGEIWAVYERFEEALEEARLKGYLGKTY